jgi:hypothetical protein
MNRPVLGTFAAAVLAASSCGGEGSQGALGQAHLSADCPSQDLTCVAQGLDGPLAVGAAARINVRLVFQGAATPPTRLVSSHADILAVDGESVRGVADGRVTLLVMLANEDAVVDFMHVWVTAADRLALSVFTADGRELGEVVTGTELLTGEDVVLAASLYARGQKLRGDTQAVFATDSDVVTLLREPTSGRTRVVARRPGSATVSVTASGLATTLSVEVKP